MSHLDKQARILIPNVSIKRNVPFYFVSLVSPTATDLIVGQLIESCLHFRGLLPVSSIGAPQKSAHLTQTLVNVTKAPRT